MKRIIPFGGHKSKQTKPVEIRVVADYGELMAIRVFAETHLGQGAIIPTTSVAEVKQKLKVAKEVCEQKIKDMQDGCEYMEGILNNLKGV